jgi:hypothetical protein
MGNYYAIMVDINTKEEKVEYTCDELTITILETYMCDMFRLHPDVVNDTLKKHSNLFWFYKDEPGEEHIVQLIFSEKIDEDNEYEHYFVYARDKNEALHTLKDYLIKQYFFM